MEVIYRAFDGKMFPTPEECLTHEKEHPLFRMFNSEGKLVTSPSDCRLLQIVDGKDGATAFIKLCESEETYSNGIDTYVGVGWYWWNGEEYQRIDPRMIEALTKCGYFER